ncbi:MAG: hypothetical protein FWC71_09690 [Defluviitaleaceae bacterium]|nr:hypothetical protein [Defluviitaleaceae bacterium]
MQALIEFVGDNRIRAMWDETSLKWWFSAIDICAALRGCDYKTAQNYYKSWTHKQNVAGSQSVTHSNQLKFLAADGKRYNTAAVDYANALRLIQTLPGAHADKLRLSLAQALEHDPNVSAQFTQLGTTNRDQPQTEISLLTITKTPIV